MKVFLLILLLFVFSCGKAAQKKSSEEKQSVSPIFNSQEIHIEVFYEAGAEPYTDKLDVLDIYLWDIFQMNLGALLEGKNIKLRIPKKLSEMTKIETQARSKWSIEDILKLSSANPSSTEKGKTTFQIFFVNGVAEINPNIIGFHIDKTKVMAIFKTVVKNSSMGDGMVQKYVEQATIIHEMGHALGLVDNGLPMTSPHKDTSHGAHCSNPKCVMYYQNEGAGSLISFILKIKEDGNLMMFDQQCVQDAKSFTP